jgi:hypothetical protein
MIKILTINVLLIKIKLITQQSVEKYFRGGVEYERF